MICSTFLSATSHSKIASESVRVNRNAFKPPVSEYVKEIVRRNFSREVEFYEFCKNRLHKQYRALRLPTSKSINDASTLDAPYWANVINKRQKGWLKKMTLANWWILPITCAAWQISKVWSVGGSRSHHTTTTKHPLNAKSICVQIWN